MRREANIPLFLWIATAVLVHLIWGGGADRGARIIEDRLDIQRFAREVLQRARGTAKPIEVALLEEPRDEPEPERPHEPTRPEVLPPDSAVKPPDNANAPERVQPSKPKPEDTRAEAKPEPQKKPEPEKLEPPKVVEAKPLPEPNLPKKIAVRQVVKDENQADNPSASFIAEHANHVAEETQARITSADQNDPNPTPGGEHSGPTHDPGDSDKTDIRQSEDRPGERDHAPSETPSSTPDKKAVAQQPSPAAAAHQEQARAAVDQRGVQAGSRASSSTRPAQQARPEQLASKETEAVPDTLHGPAGFTVPGPRQALVDQAASQARKRRPLPRQRMSSNDLLGYGSNGTTATGVNLNLMPSSAVAAIGQDELARERLIDGERRKSAHRGSWHPSDLNRWRSAIENYVPSVRLGNQTALNTQASPFANYLNAIHNRLHPIFAGTFLAALDSLPASHPMNDQSLNTSLEIVLDQDAGRIVRMGVTKTSGLTMFDIGALDSVQKASPFGPPPRAIVSPDGNVYLHWEFRRDEMACSTYNAHPYILKVQPQTAPPEVSPPTGPTLDPGEVPGTERHGSLTGLRAGPFALN